jgi:predicted PurR-regulated permease PerM
MPLDGVRWLFLLTLVSIIFPIYVYMAMGLVAAAALYPYHQRLLIFMGPKRSAGCLMLLLSLLLILPTLFLLTYGSELVFVQYNIWRAQHTAAGLQDFLATLLDHPRIRAFMIFLTRLFPLQLMDLVEYLQNMLSLIGQRGMVWVGSAASQLLPLTLGSLISLATLFVGLVEAKALVSWAHSLRILRPSVLNQTLRVAFDMSRSVLLAAVVSGMVQASVSVVLLALFRQPMVLLQGLLIFLSSFTPLVGALPYFLCLMGVYFWKQEDGLLALSVGLLWLNLLLDQLIRPLLLKGHANLHPYLGFVAAVGGLKLFGVFGVFLGPIVTGIAVQGIRALAEKSISD